MASILAYDGSREVKSSLVLFLHNIINIKKKKNIFHFFNEIVDGIG